MLCESLILMLFYCAVRVFVVYDSAYYQFLI